MAKCKKCGWMFPYCKECNEIILKCNEELNRGFKND